MLFKLGDEGVLALMSRVPELSDHIITVFAARRRKQFELRNSAVKVIGADCDAKVQAVERFLSRVNSRQVATLDQLVKGTRYEAAVRLRLDVNALPKPFQVSALASRDWSMQSEWHRWSFTP